MKKIICAVIVISMIAGGAYLYRISAYQKKVKAIQIHDVDLKSINDGKYRGRFNADVIAAEFEVTVQDHTIKDINIIENKTDRGKKAEAVVDEVVKKQTLNVDTVSGATNSSKVILKAVENALNEKSL